MSDIIYVFMGALFGAFFAAVFTRKIERDLLRQSLQKEIYDDVAAAAEASKQSLADVWSDISDFATMPVVLRNLAKHAGDSDEASQKVEDHWYAFIDRASDAVFAGAKVIGELQGQLKAYSFAYESLADSTAKLNKDYDSLLALQNETLMRLRDIDPKRLLEEDVEATLDELADTSRYKQASDAFLDDIEKLQAGLRVRLFGGLFKFDA